jgi:hypothetical protein
MVALARMNVYIQHCDLAGIGIWVRINSKATIVDDYEKVNEMLKQNKATLYSRLNLA